MYFQNYIIKNLRRNCVFACLEGAWGRRRIAPVILSLGECESERSKFSLYCLVNNYAKNIQGGSNMTGTDLCVNKSQFVPVIFEPHCMFQSFKY
jgi:hypothetical protein